MSFLQQKRSIEDIWPIYNKTVLVRVDFNVPIRNGAITSESKDARIRAAIPTIRKIIDQGGKAILMSHMGRPTGHKYAALRTSAEKRKRYIQIWTDEKGVGYTTFFAICCGDAKKKILSWSSAKEVAMQLSKAEGAGKTDLFASLSNEEKKSLLKRFQQSEERNSMMKFPQLRQYNGFDDELTLRPVATRLSELLNDNNDNDASSAQQPHVEVKFAQDCLDATSIVSTLQPTQVLLLENVRFYSDENSRNPTERLAMARKIATYGDYFASDAFGTSHRRNSATAVDLPHVMGHGCCGYSMQKEITAYSKLIGGRAPRPAVAIVGGAKVSDKINSLHNILDEINYLVVGGAMAYTFLKAMGRSIGNSFHESGQSFGDKYGGDDPVRNIDDLAKRFLIEAKARDVEVLLPVDHACHTTCEPTDRPLVTENSDVPDGYMALDIGPRTIELYERCISACRTAVWNGPMGVFEIPTYATGSFSIAKAMGDGTARGSSGSSGDKEEEEEGGEKRGLLSIVGGGASAQAAEMCGHAGRMSHVSSGGGASLDLLEGKVPPGIHALDDKNA